ncbi:MAG TPA: cytochrome P450, partial [Thermomonospora sp.]|nr:cytochrome P450 [Thermomonospora sp.]
MTSCPLGATVTAEDLAHDPHPALARLRDHEPVSWLPALGGWLVTRHDLALRVMRDAATFTVDDPRFSTAQVIGPSMLSLDGPRHTRHRDPFARPFRPARTRERFTAFVHDEVERLITALRPAGQAELRAEFAGPLAVAVVAEALALRHANPATVRSWYETFVTAISEITAGRPADAGDAYRALRAAIADPAAGSP